MRENIKIKVIKWKREESVKKYKNKSKKNEKGGKVLHLSLWKPMRSWQRSMLTCKLCFPRWSVWLFLPWEVWTTSFRNDQLTTNRTEGSCPGRSQPDREQKFFTVFRTPVPIFQIHRSKETIFKNPISKVKCFSLWFLFFQFFGMPQSRE